MKIDYDVLSLDYDLTRSVNIDIIKKILTKASINEKSFVLDFGCGTGNYACAIKNLTGANIFGAEPSDGMRLKAKEKNGDVDFRKGDHAQIPFDGGFFDLIYMTDVIHHVPDMRSMFAEFFRTLKPGGLVCILTESHEQIEKRFWSAYFPATAEADKKRYPDIAGIISAAEKCGFAFDENMTAGGAKRFVIPADFVRLVENKGYSMFRLISEDDYNNGINRLKADYENKTEIFSEHGETLLWLKKA